MAADGGFAFPTDAAGAAAAVEAACTSLGSVDPAARAAGERVLLALRNSDNAVQVAQAVLQVTRAPDAAFQAASALRSAALRDCARLGHHLPELRAWCASVVIHSQPELHPVVAAQLGALHAALLKRAWVACGDVSAAAAWLDQLTSPVTAALRGTGDVGAASRCVDALVAVVTEFCPATASPLHLSWAQHAACAKSFVDAALRPLFELACACCVQCAAASAGNGPQQGMGSTSHLARLAVPSLHLVSTCLSWDWSGSAIPGGMAGPGAVHVSHHSVVRTEAPAWCTPPHSWQALLVGSPTAPSEWLAPYLRVGGDSPVLGTALSVLLVACSMRGPVVEAPHEVRAHHVAACCAALLCLLQGPACGDPSAMRLAALAVLALATCHPPHVWPSPQGLLLLRTATQGALACDSRAFDTCVEALAMMHRNARGRGSLRPGPRGAAPAVPAQTQWDPAELAATCRDVFFAACERAMASAAAGASAEDTDDEDGASDGGLDTAGASDTARHALDDLGILARAEVGATCPRLAGAMAHCLSRLGVSVSAPGSADCDVALEHMTWLVRCASAVLADSPEGETPEAPGECCAASQAAGDVSACPVTQVAHQLLAVLTACAAKTVTCSPRLAEALCMAAARWADTWLGCASGPDAPPAVSAWAASSPNCDAALQCCAAYAAWCICDWPGEVALANVAARELLCSLTRRKACAARLLHTPGWQALCVASAAGSSGSTGAQAGSALATLPPKTHRHLLRALAGAVTGVSDTGAAAQYLRQLLGPHAGVVTAAAASPVEWLSRAGGEHTLLCALEALRGGAQATAPKSREASLALVGQAAAGCSSLAVHPAVVRRPQLRLACLRLTAGILESQLPYADEQQASQLVRFGLDVVTSGAAVTAADAALVTGGVDDVEQRQHDAAKGAKALLAILNQVACRDMCALSDPSPGTTASASQQDDTAAVAAALLHGLHVLVPVVSPLSRTYPKLGRALCEVLSHAACVHPSAMAAMPESGFGCLSAALLAGVESADAGVWGPCTEGLEALCRLQVQPAGPGSGGHMHGFVTACQEALLSRLVTHSGAPTDAVADALLPALLAAPQHWMQLHTRLEQRFAGDDVAVGAFREAVGALTTANGVTPVLDRHNARKFRANVAAFAATVRGLVRVQ